MHWSTSYVGLPWREKGAERTGLSCWGLICLVYRERFGIDLPTYAERFASHAEITEIEAVVGEATANRPWVAVEPAETRAMDVAVFRRAGVESHVGLIVEPGRMLHIEHDLDSAIVDFKQGKWAPRLAGVYRHEALQ